LLLAIHGRLRQCQADRAERASQQAKPQPAP